MCLGTQIRLLWNRGLDPAKQKLWKGHRSSQQKSALVSVAPCYNKRDIAATSVVTHWTQKRHTLSIWQLWGCCWHTWAQSLALKCWRCGKSICSLWVLSVLQVLTSSLPRALRTLQPSSLLTVNLWWSPTLADRRLHAAFQKWHWAGVCVLVLNVWKAETSSTSPFIPAAKTRKRRKNRTSPKEVSNCFSAGVHDVCCTPELCCDTYLETDKLSLTWEALSEKTNFPPGSQPDWRPELEVSFRKSLSQCWKPVPRMQVMEWGMQSHGMYGA